MARPSISHSTHDKLAAPAVESRMTKTNSPFSFGAMSMLARNNAGLLFLGLAVFIMGFLFGSMWTENKMLKNGVANTTAQTGAQAGGTQAAAGAGTQPAASPAPTTATVNLGHFPIQGSKDAKIAIVEFADLRCPFCKQFYTATESQLIKDYVDTGKAQFAFRQYEFLGPASVTAGNAAECANEQGKFWEYYKYLYENQPSESDTSMYTTDKLTEVAKGMGMNGDQFKNCLSSTKFAQNLTTDMNEGSKAGVTGTPSFVVGKIGADGQVSGTLLVGAQDYSAFKSAIDAIK